MDFKADRETLITAIKANKAIEYVTSHICVLISVSILGGYTTLSMLGLLPEAVTPEKVMLSYFFTITLFIVGFTDKSKEELKSIIHSLDKADEDKAEIKIITSQDDLYYMLMDRIREAKKKVCIMHLDQYPPTHYKHEVRNNYFEFIFDFAKNNNKIAMRRITSINEKEKGMWVKDRIIETKDVENLSMAYINIENLDNTYLKTVVSCQLIDDDEVFVLNPMSNTVSGSASFANCLYIKNKKVAQLYERYYDDLWTFANLNYNGCYILKNGRECYYDVLDNIIASVSEDTNEVKNKEMIVAKFM